MLKLLYSNMLWDLLLTQPHDEESIMQCLYDHPDCCSLVIDDKLAIHVAIEQGLSMVIIKQMLICYPACCSRKNKRGNLLLHDLLQSRSAVPSDVILLIIDGDVETVRTTTMSRELPLHIECKLRCRYIVIKKLLDIYPDATSKIDALSYLPLHSVLVNNQATSSEVALYLIDAYPESVARKKENFNLPLHIECKLHCRYDVIIRLLDVYPGAINIAGEYGNYPLHCALENRSVRAYANTSAVMHLIDAYPDAVRVEDGNGVLPLHSECENRYRYDVIHKLIDIYPDAIIIADEYENLPMDLILSHHPTPVDVVRLIYSKYQGVAFIKDQGSSPISRMFSAYYSAYKRDYPSTSCHELSMQYKALVIYMMDIYHRIISSDRKNVIIDAFPIMARNPPQHRLLLNLASPHLLTSIYLQNHHDMNYRARAHLLHNVYQLSSSYKHHMISSNCINQEQHHRGRHLISKIFEACNNNLDWSMFGVLISMLAAADRLDMDHDSIYDNHMKYGWMKGDDIGCVLLRMVVLYL